MHKHNKCAALSSRYRTLFLEAAFPAGRSFVTLVFITFACAVINPLLFCEQNDYLNNCWFCAAGYLQLSGFLKYAHDIGRRFFLLFFYVFKLILSEIITLGIGSR